MQLTLSQRFTLFLNSKEITKTDFANRVGMSSQTISNIATGTVASPKADFFEALLKFYPELNLRWLLLGEEPMLLSDKTNTEQAMENRHMLREPDTPGYEKTNTEMLKLIQQLTEMLAEEQRRSRKLEEKIGKMESELLAGQQQMKSLGEEVAKLVRDAKALRRD